MSWFFIIILALWIGSVSGEVITLKRKVRNLEAKVRSLR